MGNAAAAASEAKLMYPLVLYAINQTTKAPAAGTASTGKTPIRAPSEVATPFPPRNLSHGEKTLPKTAQTMVAIHQRLCSMFESKRPSVFREMPAIKTGRAPLSRSILKQRKKYFRPRTRPTFVAPMFLDPC